MIGRKKFVFKSRERRKLEKKENVTPLPNKAEEGTKKGIEEIKLDQSCVKNLMNEQVILRNETQMNEKTILSTKSYTISDLNNCKVYVCFETASLRIQNVVNCEIHCG